MGGGDDLTSPEWQDLAWSRCRRLHSPGATSCGRKHPKLGKQDGAMATSSRSL
ncbi:hypothetical protein C2845_PM01G43200 [Panicum miliaceum]|uniref:Uncharacterized protein n=1 Tax=Panicum miliaceum TaxID=4540 RepID=A0A3L6TP88_PANMI|nr:hypothetical protein C2845_PM01G43200 [Panicum miliaceum]